MESRNFGTIRPFLRSGIFDERSNDFALLIKFLRSKKQSSKISILYGETYDKYGLTIDSVKYYLVLEVFTRLLREAGFSVSSNLLVGDVASIRNQNIENEAEILDKVAENYELIKSIKSKLGFSFDVIKMSECLEKEEFKENYERVRRIFEFNTEFKELLKPTILKDRLKQEIEAGF